MSTFVNQVAFITGAGSGLGRQLALLLAAEGAAVAVVDLHEEALRKLEAALPGRRFAWAVADVRDLPGLRRAVGQLQEQVGSIDLLIANAGIGCETSALNFHGEDVEAIVRVNLIGVANSIDTVLPGMLARRRGHLVGMSSLASYRGLPHMAGYCAAKAGVNALLEGLRVELRPHGVAVTIICPGWVRTPMTEAVALPMPGILEVDDAARRILGAIRRRDAFFAFPRTSARRVRLLRWLPSRLSDWLTERTLRKMAAR
jgi:NAD(P)-dependent dehydrogenase (short-subunit alcohol dehydrogenase family)